MQEKQKNTPGRKIEYHEHDTPKEREFPEISNVASWSECTGLMYKTPKNSAEWAALQQLSPMGIPRVGEEPEGTVPERPHRAKNPKKTGKTAEDASGERNSGRETEEYVPRHMADGP